MVRTRVRRVAGLAGQQGQKRGTVTVALARAWKLHQAMGVGTATADVGDNTNRGGTGEPTKQEGSDAALLISSAFVLMLMLMLC